MGLSPKFPAHLVVPECGPYLVLATNDVLSEPTDFLCFDGTRWLSNDDDIPTGLTWSCEVTAWLCNSALA